MTWELHSPDLPFLNEITVIQNKHGFWENISSYAPVLSAFFALISLFVTLWIAKEARKIASDQKNIAQNKLDYDLFSKKGEIITIFFNSMVKIYHNEFHKTEDITSVMDELYGTQVFAAFFFKDSYLESLSKVRSSISSMATLKTSLIKDPKSIQLRNQIVMLKNDFEKNIELLNVIMTDFTPEFIRNRILISKAAPASPDKPQPTGLKAFRARLKRAVCEWKRPLP